MNKKKLIQLGVITVPALVIAIGIGVKLGYLRSNKIAPRVTVGDVQVGGLTETEAAAKLKQWSYKRLSDELSFSAGNRKWAGTLRDIGVQVDASGMAHRAYAIGRKGSFLSRMAQGLGLMPCDRHLQIAYKYDWKPATKIFDKISDAVGTPARDAQIVFDDGGRRITPEVPGLTVDFNKSADLIKSAVESGQSSVVLPIVVDTPDVKTADLEQVDTLLARYSTPYKAWRKDRTHNVRLAVERVNGKLVKSGGVFSYNDAVGPRQKINGFKDALIYVRGKIIPGTGGGVCQVSSTLYNAALLANMDILERSHHSMPVPYVPLGRDATVAYGLLDLKFRNNTSAPVYVMARMGPSRVTVDLYGARHAKRDVKIVTSTPTRVAKGGKTLTTVAVYRVVSDGGTKVHKKRISRDRYLPAAPHPVESKPKSVRIASVR